MIQDASLAGIVPQLRSGELGVDVYLESVREHHDAVEGKIQSFVSEPGRWDRVDAATSRLEEQYAHADRRPALYGVPVGVKDIFHVDGLATRAGSSLPPEELAGPQAATVTALRDAGAVVLGKTVTTEFAFYDPGPTRNPHDTDHTPGGSSSGSAAAVAAGLCPLALGTQTIGSITRPAAFCGVVGVKPSYGRIPIDGVLPLSTSVDHVGFFTQDVPSARLAAPTLYDEYRPVEVQSEPTLGVPDGPYLEQAEPAALGRYHDQVDRLEAAGYEVVRTELFGNIDAVNDRHNRLAAAETALSHNEWYPAYGDRYGPELAGLIEEGLDVPAREIGEARAGRRQLRETVEEVMNDHGIDVWVCPSAPGPAPEGIDSTGDPVMNLPWTHSGLPTVTVPAGTLDGLPLGLQCGARYQDDERLLAWADGIAAALDG